MYEKPQETYAKHWSQQLEYNCICSAKECAYCLLYLLKFRLDVAQVLLVDLEGLELEVFAPDVLRLEVHDARRLVNVLVPLAVKLVVHGPLELLDLGSRRGLLCNLVFSV